MTIVAVIKDSEGNSVGTAQVTACEAKWCASGYIYGITALIGARGDAKDFKKCVDILEESLHNHWCLIWTEFESIKEKYQKLGIDIASVEHVDLYQLTEKVIYESSNRQE